MAASTTQRLTYAILGLIARFCVAQNAGVIVRHKGEDVGVTADDLVIANGKVTWPNAPAAFNTLTIPKATIAQMEIDLQPKVMATLFAELTPAQQNEVREQLGINEMYGELV